MSLELYEIKQIEKVYHNFMEWAKNLTYQSPSNKKVQLMPSWRYKKEILFLCAKTNIGAKVEKEFVELDQLHQEYESWRAKRITEDNYGEFLLLIDSLKGILYDLADTLKHVAECARKEKNLRILKSILNVMITFFIFLAALITVFNYLGLLDQFKAIIGQVLSSE